MFVCLHFASPLLRDDFFELMRSGIIHWKFVKLKVHQIWAKWQIGSSRVIYSNYKWFVLTSFLLEAGEGKRSSFYQPTKPPGLSKMEVFRWWNFCVFVQAQKTSRFLPWKTAGGVLGAARKLPSQSGGVAACWESQVFPGEGWYLEDYRRYRKWLLTPICKPWMAIGQGVPQPYLGGRKLTMGQLTTYPSVMGPDPPPVASRYLEGV